MNLQLPSPFENIRSPSPSGIGSSVGTPRSLSSSLTCSPLELQTNSPLSGLADGAPKPSVTPSLLDSPLSREPHPDKFPRHTRYYFEDKMAVFLVEGCLFRVHRYHLDKESQVFPAGIGSNHDPIELSGVTRTEFESLLDFLYDGMHTETTHSLATWSSLLSISTHFEMKRIRSRAISEILAFRPRIDPVDQIVLALKHAIPEWLPLGYNALCQREDAIEVEEAKKLGLETTVMLAKAREAVRKTSVTSHTSNPFAANFDTIPVHNDLKYPFGRSNSAQIKTSPNPAPFDEALVRRVVDEIFWPAQTMPEPEILSPKISDRPSNELSNTLLPTSPMPASWSSKSEAPSSELLPDLRGTGVEVCLGETMPDLPLPDCKLAEQPSSLYAFGLPDQGAPSRPVWPWSTNTLEQTPVSEHIPKPEECNQDVIPTEMTMIKKGGKKKGKKKSAQSVGETPNYS